MSDEPKLSPLDFQRLDEETMRQRSATFGQRMRARRSVRHFSSEPVPLDVVERCIEAAAQAPSGANKQPWTFVAVTDANVRRAIRIACEERETAFYSERAPQRWLEDLKPLGTGPGKEHLETAPQLIVVFAHRRGDEAGKKNYYVTESVGIAVGFLIAALTNAGLATLTYTPAPMRFLADILRRPANESPFMVLPIGYPAQDCCVPDLSRKPLSEVLVRV